MRTRKDGEVTREKIILAARQVFGDKGFYKATHAEISRIAGVNSALINFHFGTKVGLYQAMWEYIEQDIEARYPISCGIPASAPPEERLYGNVLCLLKRALDPYLEGFHRIFTMEMVNPTGMVNEAMESRLQHYRSYTQSILRELLGPAANERTIELCEMSMISQCHVILPPLPGHRKGLHLFMQADAEELAQHITRFSLAGIKAIRQHYEQGV